MTLEKKVSRHFFLTIRISMCYDGHSKWAMGEGQWEHRVKITPFLTKIVNKMNVIIQVILILAFLSF